MENSAEFAIPDPIELANPVCERILALFYNMTFTRRQIEDAIEQHLTELVCSDILPIDVNREFVLQYITTREGLTTGFGYVYFKDTRVSFAFVGYQPDGSNVYSKITVKNGNLFPENGTFLTNDGKEIECRYEMVPETRVNHYEYDDETPAEIDLSTPPKKFNWADESRTVVGSSATATFFLALNNKFGNIEYTDVQKEYMRENPSREQNKDSNSEPIACNLLLNAKMPITDEIKNGKGKEIRVLSVTYCGDRVPDGIEERRIHDHFAKFNNSSDTRIFRYFSENEKEMRTSWPVVFCHRSRKTADYPSRTTFFVRYDGRTRDEEAALIMNWVTTIDGHVFTTRWATDRSNQARLVLNYQLKEAYEVVKKAAPTTNAWGARGAAAAARSETADGWTTPHPTRGAGRGYRGRGAK